MAKKKSKPDPAPKPLPPATPPLDGETDAGQEAPAEADDQQAPVNAADQAPEGETAEAVLPEADPSRPVPRSSRADSFEQNPRSNLRAVSTEGVGRAELDDSTRVREALRSVIEQGDSVKDAARDWHVAPSTVAEWRNRYQDLLKEDSPIELLEADSAKKDADLTCIPDATRGIFTENWDRLVTETAATPSDFRQSPRQIFLQTSRLTSWLFQDGHLDRGILTGALSGLVGLAILTSFLMADYNPPPVVTVPEAPPGEDIVIDEAAAVAQSFFKAPNWQDRLKFVRQPDAVREMMESYYRDHSDAPINDAALSLAMPVRHLVNLSFDVPSLNRSHFLCVVISKGRHLVDWESSSLYQEAHLAKLRAARSTEPVRIAVTVAKSEAANYYNYAFRDATRWECYQLGYPGLNLSLFGYAAKDSSDAITLDAMLGIVDKQAVVMEVRFPLDAATDNQVEIISVLRSEWVPDEP